MNILQIFRAAVLAAVTALSRSLGLELHLQYAALPWRRQGAGEVEVLLITSRGRRRWLIPKGWPIAGMSPPRAAAQEAFEEAGVRGEPAPRPLGAYLYAKKTPSGARRPVRVAVFPLEVTEVTERWPEWRQRERRWAPPQAAAELVEETELAQLILSFAGEIGAAARPAPVRPAPP